MLPTSINFSREKPIEITKTFNQIINYANCIDAPVGSTLCGSGLVEAGRAALVIRVIATDLDLFALAHPLLTTNKVPS